MHIFQSKQLIIWLIALTALISTNAQTSIDEPIVEIDFQVIAWGEPIREVYFESAKDGRQEIKAHAHIRSNSYKYKGPQTLHFYRKAETEEGPQKQSVGSIKVDLNSSKLLLIFTPKGRAFQIIELPDDLGAFPYGSFKFFNLTQSPVAAELQDERLKLEPRKQVTKRIKSNKDGSDLDVKIAIGEPEGWKMFYTNSWGHNEQRRTLVLIFENEDGKKVVRRLREQAPASN